MRRNDIAYDTQGHITDSVNMVSFTVTNFLGSSQIHRLSFGAKSFSSEKNLVRENTSSTSEIIQQTLRPNHKLCAFPHHTKLVCDALVRHNLWKSTLRWSFCSGPAATFIPIRFMLTNVTDKETNKHPEKLIQWATVPCILHAKMFFFLLLRSYTQPFLCI